MTDRRAGAIELPLDDFRRWLDQMKKDAAENERSGVAMQSAFLFDGHAFIGHAIRMPAGMSERGFDEPAMADHYAEIRRRYPSPSHEYGAGVDPNEESGYTVAGAVWLYMVDVGLRPRPHGIPREWRHPNATLDLSGCLIELNPRLDKDIGWEYARLIEWLGAMGNNRLAWEALRLALAFPEGDDPDYVDFRKTYLRPERT